MSAARISSRARRKIYIVVLLLVFSLAYFRKTLLVTYSLLSLPVTWGLDKETFFLSEERDGFDITFANYSSSPDIDESSPRKSQMVPYVLHHIRLGSSPAKAEWIDARNACLALHPGWEAMAWTDENSRGFVAEKYPELLSMWDGYKFPIQRVDALRYMVLYHYGGVILDMDLHCLRPLTPLTQFPFLAPAAHPIGFSNGFLMAQKEHPFVRELIDSLRPYNRNWFGLPYATVMFSTGCHYASTIHALQAPALRQHLKILGGTPSKPNLHALNGNVTTPLFHHLGASSWHSFDAFLIVSIGHLGTKGWSAILLVAAMFGVAMWGAVGLLKRYSWKADKRGRPRGRYGDEILKLEEGKFGRLSVAEICER